jgi:hypothetical protein
VPAGTLVGAGGELVIDAVLLYAMPLRIRAGAGVPLAGGGTPRAHIVVAPSF